MQMVEKKKPSPYVPHTTATELLYRSITVSKLLENISLNSIVSILILSFASIWLDLTLEYTAYPRLMFNWHIKNVNMRFKKLGYKSILISSPRLNELILCSAV